ncbi:MAG: hypothetical protein IJZ86_01310 [Bacteroides sp.]|nr:hypothetical protein [Bacteroides sp.]
MVHATRNLGIGIDGHRQLIGRGVHGQHAEPAGEVAAVLQQRVHAAIGHVVLGKGREVVLPPLAQRQQVGAFLQLLHTLHMARLGEDEIALHGGQPVDDHLHEQGAAAHLQPVGLHAAVGTHQRALAGRHGVHRVAELSAAVGPQQSGRDQSLEERHQTGSHILAILAEEVGGELLQIRLGKPFHDTQQERAYTIGRIGSLAMFVTNQYRLLLQVFYQCICHGHQSLKIWSQSTSTKNSSVFRKSM